MLHQGGRAAAVPPHWEEHVHAVATVVCEEFEEFDGNDADNIRITMYGTEREVRNPTTIAM